MDNIKLTKTQQRIFDTIADLAKNDRDVRGFLCLPMSGKSFLFKHIEDYFKGDNIVDNQVLKCEVTINFTQPVFWDKKIDMDRFVEAIHKGLKKRYDES